MANLVPLHIDKDTGNIVARGGATGGSGGSGKGFLYEQLSPAAVWNIPHGQGSDKVLIQIYDDTGELTFPNEILIIDLANVTVNFNDPMAGTAHLIFFT